MSHRKPQPIKTRKISALPETNGVKQAEIARHFEQVKTLKNTVSEILFREHRHRLLTTEGVKWLRQQFYKRFSEADFLSAWERQKLVEQIALHYQSCLKAHMRNAKCFVQSGMEIKRYKKTVRHKATGEVIHRPGDLRSRRLKEKPCSWLRKLARYLLYVPAERWDTLTIQHEALDAYLGALRSQPEKWRRLKRYLYLKQRRALNQVPQLDYRTGSYRKAVRENPQADSRCSYVYTDDSNTRYQYWYRFKIARQTVIHVPLSVRQGYNADLRQFNLGAEHYVSLSETGRLSIGLQLPVAATNTVPNPVPRPIKQAVGIDLNVADNFMAIEGLGRIDFDRQYLDRLIAEVKQLDAIGYQHLCDSQLKRLGRLVRRNEWYFKRLISQVLDGLQARGVTDIVLEDLQRFDGKRFFSQRFGIQFNRVLRLLRLSNIKSWVKEQALNRGMKCHLTPAPLTSQRCNECLHAERANRKGTQFACVECGHQAHSDENASSNIGDNVRANVLCARLHDVDDAGCLVPKKGLSHAAIRRAVKAEARARSGVSVRHQPHEESGCQTTECEVEAPSKRSVVFGCV